MDATQIRCSDAVMSQETQFFEALRGIERFEVEGPMLRLYSRHGGEPLRFVLRRP